MKIPTWAQKWVELGNLVFFDVDFFGFAPQMDWSSIHLRLLLESAGCMAQWRLSSTRVFSPVFRCWFLALPWRTCGKSSNIYLFWGSQKLGIHPEPDVEVLCTCLLGEVFTMFLRDRAASMLLEVFIDLQQIFFQDKQFKNLQSTGRVEIFLHPFFWGPFFGWGSWTALASATWDKRTGTSTRCWPCNPAAGACPCCQCTGATGDHRCRKRCVWFFPEKWWVIWRF